MDPDDLFPGYTSCYGHFIGWQSQIVCVVLSVSHRPVQYKLNEHCLCYLGDIPDLFSDEEMDMIVTSIRMELRGLGLIDSRDNCWSFFIERIRRQLKVLITRHPGNLY